VGLRRLLWLNVSDIGDEEARGGGGVDQLQFSFVGSYVPQEPGFCACGAQGLGKI